VNYTPKKGKGFFSVFLFFEKKNFLSPSSSRYQQDKKRVLWFEYHVIIASPPSTPTRGRSLLKELKKAAWPDLSRNFHGFISIWVVWVNGLGGKREKKTAS
jgi:hypothetical protein